MRINVPTVKSFMESSADYVKPHACSATPPQCSHKPNDVIQECTMYMMAGFRIIMGMKKCIEVREEQTPEKKEPSK